MASGGPGGLSQGAGLCWEVGEGRACPNASLNVLGKGTGPGPGKQVLPSCSRVPPLFPRKLRQDERSEGRKRKAAFKLLEVMSCLAKQREGRDHAHRDLRPRSLPKAPRLVLPSWPGGRREPPGPLPLSWKGTTHVLLLQTLLRLPRARGAVTPEGGLGICFSTHALQCGLGHKAGPWSPRNSGERAVEPQSSCLVIQG